MANLRRFATMSVVVALAAVGCSQGSKLKVVPVSGKVTFKNAPLEGATVSFVQDYVAGKNALPASGVTDAQGVYKLTTQDGTKAVTGAVPGKYNVIVTKTTEMGGVGKMDMGTMTQEQINQMSPEDMKKMGGQGGGSERTTSTGVAAGGMGTTPQSLIPERYGSPTESKLEADVKDGGAQTFDFNLEE